MTSPHNHPGRIGVMLMTRDLDQGGVQRDVVKIATHLNPARFDPHVATFITGGIREQELRDANIPVLHLPVGAVLSPGGFHGAKLLAQYIQTRNIRILHSYDPTATVGVPVARWLRLPVIMSSQLSYRDIMDWKTRALMRLTDSLVDAVLVNCEALRHHMIDDEGVSGRRIELCYNGVDTTQFYPADVPRPDILAGASLVIGTVCALRPEKALGLMQEAFAIARRSSAQALSNAKLLIVGSGDELPRLENNARQFGIEDASLFVPATPDVPRWLRAMDIFVLPSLSEAFSNSLLEAMACGCAVIGSQVGGTPELTGAQQERGLLFNRGDADHLARQLSLLIERESLRRELAAKAATFVKENLTIETAARRTAAIYEKLLPRS